MHRLSYRGFSPHPVREYTLATSKDVPQYTSLQQQGISHLSCSRVTRARPPSPAALAFRRAAVRCGFTSTVVVPCIRPGTVLGFLSCAGMATLPFAGLTRLSEGSHIARPPFPPAFWFFLLFAEAPLQEVLSFPAFSWYPFW